MSGTCLADARTIWWDTLVECAVTENLDEEQILAAYREMIAHFHEKYGPDLDCAALKRLSQELGASVLIRAWGAMHRRTALAHRLVLAVARLLVALGIYTVEAVTALVHRINAAPALV